MTSRGRRGNDDGGVQRGISRTDGSADDGAESGLGERLVEGSRGPSAETFNADIAHLARDVATLRLDPKNARLHKPRNLQTIAESLRRFGQQRALVVRPDGTIIAGNGTMRAATEILGWRRLAAITFDGDDRAARAFALADNRSAELADWDYDELTAAIVSLSDDAELVRSLGWDEDELAQIARTADVVGAAPAVSTGDASDDAPEFAPSETPPPRLDRRKSVRCPHCGGEFEPSA